MNKQTRAELAKTTEAPHTPSRLWISDKYGIEDNNSIEKQVYRGLGLDPKGLSVEEQLNILDLDWQPRTSPIRYGELYEHETTASQVLYRPTDGQFMGIVSDTWYSECQSFENILKTFFEFCENSGLTLERVGAIETFSRKNKKGHQQLYLKLWAVAGGLEDSFLDLGRGDLVEAKLQLVCPYIYGFGYTGILGAYRKVCNNGLHKAVRLGQKVIKHSGSKTIGNIQQALENARTAWLDTQAQLIQLSQTPIGREEAVALVVSKFGYPDREFSEQPKIVKTILDLYFSGNFIGADFESAANTAWGLLNCATQYFQHISVSKNPNTQLNSVWQGDRCNKTNEFLKSISAFATEKRNREKLKSTSQTYVSIRKG